MGAAIGKMYIAAFPTPASVLSSPFLIGLLDTLPQPLPTLPQPLPTLCQPLPTLRQPLPTLCQLSPDLPQPLLNICLSTPRLICDKIKHGSFFFDPCFLGLPLGVADPQA